MLGSRAACGGRGYGSRALPGPAGLSPQRLCPGRLSPCRLYPGKSLFCFQRHPRQSCSPTLLRASSFASPHPAPRRTRAHRPAHLFPAPMPNFPEQVQPGAASLTLSRQLTFSVGYTTFPQRAHWGFMVAAPGGGGWAAAAGGSKEPLWHPPASPAPPPGRREGGGRPRTGSGLSAGPGGAGARGGGGAWRRGRPRSRLGLGCARSAALALQVPVTHTHSRPPLALTRSPASPPPRRPNPPARPDRSGRGRARRAPEGGPSGGKGGRTPGALGRRPRAAPVRPGASPVPQPRRGGRVGAGERGWEPGGRRAAAAPRRLPAVPCGKQTHCPARAPAPRLKFPGPRGRPLPAWARGPRRTPPCAEPRPGRGETDPRDPCSRGAGCVAAAPTQPLPWKGVPCEPGGMSLDPRWGRVSAGLPTPVLFISVLAELLVILGLNQAFLD